MDGAIKSWARRAVSQGVTRVELRESLESVLNQLDVSRLLPDESRQQVDERENRSEQSSGFALFVLVEPGRFLPALGVRALRARLCRIENSPVAPEISRALSANRCVPLRGYLYEENGATVLLTYDQASPVLPAKEGRSSSQNISACVTSSAGTSTVGM